MVEAEELGDLFVKLGLDRDQEDEPEVTIKLGIMVGVEMKVNEELEAKIVAKVEVGEEAQIRI